VVLPEAAPIALDARGDRDLELGLSLSGGGYRAMNELGWLRKLDAISSVSGGSIAAGLLGAV
jgi:NTE family protein